MAGSAPSTRISRRCTLAGGAAALALPAAAARTPVDARGNSDARIAFLAARYRRSMDALVDWIDFAEQRHGPLAYRERPEYRARYEELVAIDRLHTTALAQARPTSLRGLVLKLRPAFYCRTLYDAEPDCDAAILVPALWDLEWLAGLRG